MSTVAATPVRLAMMTLVPCLITRLVTLGRVPQTTGSAPVAVKLIVGTSGALVAA